MSLTPDDDYSAGSDPAYDVGFTDYRSADDTAYGASPDQGDVDLDPGFGSEADQAPSEDPGVVDDSTADGYDDPTSSSGAEVEPSDLVGAAPAESQAEVIRDARNSMIADGVGIIPGVGTVMGFGEGVMDTTFAVDDFFRGDFDGAGTKAFDGAADFFGALPVVGSVMGVDALVNDYDSYEARVGGATAAEAPTNSERLEQDFNQVMGSGTASPSQAPVAAEDY